MKLYSIGLGNSNQRAAGAAHAAGEHDILFDPEQTIEWSEFLACHEAVLGFISLSVRGAAASVQHAFNAALSA